MATIKEKELINSEKEVKDYLEKKYGKEPRVSAEELNKIRWSWH